MSSGSVATCGVPGFASSSSAASLARAALVIGDIISGVGSGMITFYTAPQQTVTAGTAVSMAPVMSIDNTGNVGIGTTSPVSKLDVSGSFYAYQGNITLRDEGIANEGGQINLLGQGANTAWSIDNNNGRFRWHHDGAEYATISAAGHFGIGTANPGDLLHLSTLPPRMAGG